MRWFTVLTLFLPIMVTFSCRHAEKPVPVLSALNQSETTTPASFEYPVVVFIYPGNSQADSLKKALGMNEYFAYADKMSAFFAQTRTLAAGNAIKTWSGNPGKYRFITRDGVIIDLDLSHSSEPWKQILFNGRDAPVLINPGESPGKFSQVFGLKQATQQKRKTQPVNKVEPGNVLVQSAREADKEAGIPGIPGIRSSVIRLFILPGQTSPPPRQVPEGYRIVNSYISPERRFWMLFDNDLFSNTDRYYTNGVVLGYTAPALSGWKPGRLMLSLRRNSIVHASVSLHHGMFTPYTTKEAPTLSGDRPYASTLFLRYSQSSEDAGTGISLTSAIDAGVIGDAALGRYLQRAVHSSIPNNDEPLGWDTQIRNDLVVNYSVTLLKQMLALPAGELFASGRVQFGTLYTNASVGMNGRFGVFSPALTPIPAEYSQLSDHPQKWQYELMGGFEFSMIGYDATLQGGLFNKNNIYALKPEELERMVAKMHLGVSARYRKIGISLSQYYLSREFRQGKQHLWGQIGLTYGY